MISQSDPSDIVTVGTHSMTRATLRYRIDAIFDAAKRRQDAEISAAYDHYHRTGSVEEGERMINAAYDAYSTATSDETIKLMLAADLEVSQ